MLQATTFKFLKDLHKHNDRTWFDKNRNRYETAKADFDNFTEEVIKAFVKVDKRLAGLLVKDSVYRIYRDVRFSKNKLPYKTSFSASVNIGGRKSGKAGYYFQIDPVGEWGCMIAGGLWMPEAPKLKAVRQEIQYHTDEFKKIIGAKDLKKWFGELEDQKLKTNPKGFDKTDPDIELFKYISYIVSTGLEEKDFYSKTILKKFTETYKAMLPLLDFLNRADA
jgi:uncharacterized protein (TIGR02453 family)